MCVVHMDCLPFRSMYMGFQTVPARLKHTLFVQETGILDIQLIMYNISLEMVDRSTYRTSIYGPVGPVCLISLWSSFIFALFEFQIDACISIEMDEVAVLVEYR